MKSNFYPVRKSQYFVYANLICLALAATGCGGGGGGTTPGAFTYSVSDGFIKAAGGEVPITITKSGSGAITWTVEGLSAAPWISSSSVSSGDDSANLRLIVGANSGAPRTADLAVTGSDGSRKSFTVEQTAARSSQLRSAWDESNPGWSFIYEDYLSANKPYSVTLSSGTDEPRRVGSSSQRFEVRRGDCGGLDCVRADGARERSEYAQNGEQNKPGEAYWYAWSMYVPEDFQDAGNVAGTSRVFTAGQFQQRSSFVPAFLLGKEFGGDFVLRTFVTDTGSAPKLRFVVLPNSQFLGHWHDFVVHASWTTEPSGFFRLWANGKQVVDYSGQTMTVGNTEVFFKYGTYRIASPSENINSVLYFDEVRRGTTRSAVDIRELERN